MAVLDIVLYPDAPLTEKAEPYDSVGPDMPQLASDMFETMEAYDGVGLAGPQVGLKKRIVVLHAPDEEPLCLINPELSGMEGCVEGEEGCLSLPQVFAVVPRAEKLHVRALDPYGAPVEFDAEGFKARIIQHECDHLDGRLFPDRLDILSREALLREWADVRKSLFDHPEDRGQVL